MKKVRIGDYVEYVPNLEECVVLASDSGHKEEQIFYPPLTKRWRVSRVDDSVELFAEVGSLTLYGQPGLRNVEGLLDYVSEAYVNVRYAVSARSLGSQRPVLPVRRGITCRLEGEEKLAETNREWFCGDDAEWLIEHDLLPKQGLFWYAEGFEDQEEDEVYSGCRCMDAEMGDLFGVWFQYECAGKLMKHYSHKKKVLVFVRLKPEVRFEDGKGTVRSPWKVRV